MMMVMIGFIGKFQYRWAYERGDPEGLDKDVRLRFCAKHFVFRWVFIDISGKLDLHLPSKPSP